MRSGTFRFSVLLAVSLLGAGCLGFGGGVGTASVSGGGSTGLANDMLAHPPGSDVKPTGVTKEFDLYVCPMPHEVYPGAKMAMWGMTLNADCATATVPGPTLRVTEGDTMLVHFHVALSGPYNHTLHWHGLDVPNDQDGVPFMTQKPIEPGQSGDYQFIAKPAGTYWYHCHVDAQHHQDMGMYGMVIVDPQDPNQDPHYDGEFVMILGAMDRFHLEGGQPAQNNLPQGGDVYQYQDFGTRQANDVLTRNPTVSDKVTGTPARPTRDYYPVTYAPYTANYNTFTINGMSYPFTSNLVVEQGKTYRIRMLDAAAVPMTLHLHGHHLLVTHKDGVGLMAPYWVDTVALFPGERYDVYVKADNPGLWDFHDHMGTHTQNDDIFPGGAMTMLCYSTIPGCADMGGHKHGTTATNAGQLLMQRWAESIGRGLP